MTLRPGLEQPWKPSMKTPLRFPSRTVSTAKRTCASKGGSRRTMPDYPTPPIAAQAPRTAVAASQAGCADPGIAPALRLVSVGVADVFGGARLGETGPLSQGVQACRKALRICYINSMEVRKKMPRGFKKRSRGFK
jgi:hypothetical protein